jgi:hypothetical protein
MTERVLPCHGVSWLSPPRIFRLLQLRLLQKIR